MSQNSMLELVQVYEIEKGGGFIVQVYGFFLHEKEAGFIARCEQERVLGCQLAVNEDAKYMIFTRRPSLTVLLYITRNTIRANN